MSTTLPIDLTTDRLIEFLAGPGLGTIRTIAMEEIGRDPYAAPSPTTDDACGAIMLEMALQGSTGEDIRQWLHWSPEAIAYRLTPPEPEPPPVTDGTEAGVITIDRPALRDETGACWVWKGMTDFLLFYRDLTGATGTAADTEAYFTERIALGANVLRVFAMVGWDDLTPRFYPQDFPDYYARLRRFADRAADRGVRLEIVVFADAQLVMPDAADRKSHLQNVLAALAGTIPLYIEGVPYVVDGVAWNVFVEIANEPFKNLPGGDQEAIDLARSAQALNTGLLIASGEYSSWPPAPTADYGTTHCDRTDDWPRKGKDIMDRQDNSGDTPWIGDEPMGCAEQTDPGRRDANPDNHAWYAACCRMFGAGATFHPDDGVHSLTPMGPNQTACGQAFFWAHDWMPPEALLWPYQRGDMGSEAGFGNMPILHDDALESRSYCKTEGGRSWCIQIQTTRVDAAGHYAPVPRDGWRVVETPRLGFVYLEKP